MNRIRFIITSLCLYLVFLISLDHYSYNAEISKLNSDSLNVSMYISSHISIDDSTLHYLHLIDEKYYLEIDSSRFEFLKDIIDDEEFKSDTLKYIKECKKYYEYKEKQRPIIEANKAFEKQKREFLKEVKMSKEAPTKKQLYYYEKLCKKYSLEKRELESKLDARNEIDRIINEHNEYYGGLLNNPEGESGE